MEEDEQSATPTALTLLESSADEPMLTHSSSAPDLRLLLTTALPDTRDMFLPTFGSFAGALVPYKSPQVSDGCAIELLVCCACMRLDTLLLSTSALDFSIIFVSALLRSLCNRHWPHYALIR